MMSVFLTDERPEHRAECVGMVIWSDTLREWHPVIGEPFEPPHSIRFFSDIFCVWRIKPMNFDRYWAAICDRNPRFKNNGDVTITADSLEALVKQAFAMGEKRGQEAARYSNKPIDLDQLF